MARSVRTSPVHTAMGQPLPLAFVLLWVVLSWAGPSQAAERLALVIGNGTYAHLKTLDNPPSDATKVAGILRGLDFTLIGQNGKSVAGPLLDLDETGFSKAVRAFAERAKGAEIALVYYAGHGMQIGGQPYLLPVDVPADDLELLRRNSIELESVLTGLDGKAELVVAVFDACREIPELRSAVAEATRDSGYGAQAYRGLARVQSRGRSRIVAYSGAAGQLVADGAGPHSPYTELLLEQLGSPDAVEDVFQRVAWEFGERHGGQHPEVLIQGVKPERFFLAGNAESQDPTGRVAPHDHPLAPDGEALFRVSEIKPHFVQIALSDLGYDPGTIDGIIGPRTIAAIKRWKRSHPRWSPGQPEGLLVPEQTVSLFEEAARSGGIRSQNILGLMYWTGIGVPRSSGEAVRWLQLATSKGDMHAKANLERVSQGSLFINPQAGFDGFSAPEPARSVGTRATSVKASRRSQDQRHATRPKPKRQVSQEDPGKDRLGAAPSQAPSTQRPGLEGWPSKL